MPLVSIVAVNYNNSQWVLETLNSIAAQTYKNIELIIVDDCSTDDSPELINNWLESFNGIYKFIRHEKNKGVCAACNSGFYKASGDYISYIATDDIMLPEKTAIQADGFQNLGAEVGMLYSDAYLIQENSSLRYGFFIQNCRQDFIWPPSGWIFDELVSGNFIPGMSVMIRKEVIERVGYFDEDLVFEDYDMWLRISKIYKVDYVDKPLVKYRIRPGSLVTKLNNFETSFIKIWLKHLDNKNCRDKLFRIAKYSYLSNDKENINLFQQNRGISKEVERVMKIIDRRIPHWIGSRLIYRMLK